MDNDQMNGDNNISKDNTSPYQSNIESITDEKVKPEKRKRTMMALLVAVSLATGAIGGAATTALMINGNNGYYQAQNGATSNNTSDSTDVDQSIIKETSAGSTTSMETSDIASQVMPSIVAICTSVENSRGMYSQESEGAGSGIIISEDGYIVTNEHVISGASKIEVVTNDGDRYDAEIVGSDTTSDIAAIKVSATGLTPAVFGDSDALVVGEKAVAIGNPLGELTNTVTVGIISAKDREITIDGQTMTLLQTDAAINVGNSGGALVNSSGLVIGINTAKTSAIGVEGLGFAIPINQIEDVINQLVDNGYVEGRTKVGVSTRDIDEDYAAISGLTAGINVLAVEEGSGADKASIEVGDVIVEFDGHEVSTTAEINEIKKEHTVGDKVKVKVVRNGKTIELTVILGDANE